MTRAVYISIPLLTFAGLALAQVPPPVPAGPGFAQGPGRGNFAPVVVGPSAPVSPEVAIPRPTPEELVQVVEPTDPADR